MSPKCACNVLSVAVLTVGLFAEVSPGASDLPSNQQVLAFLTQTIDWYRHGAFERQIATEPVDLVFLEDNRAIALPIVRLSFDFASADAAIAATSPPMSRTQSTANASRSSPDLAQFLMWQNNAELASRQASQQIEDIRKKLLSARGADRRKLQAALDTAQSRVTLLQAGSATLQQLVEFVRGFGVHGARDLASSIDDLARTVPEGTEKREFRDNTDHVRRDSSLIGSRAEVRRCKQSAEALRSWRGLYKAVLFGTDASDSMLSEHWRIV